MCCPKWTLGGVLAALLLAVSAGPVLACTVTAGSLKFGAYNFGLTTPTDTVTSLRVVCPAGTPFQVALERPGAGPLLMTQPGPGQPLRFELYVDASRSQVWGNGTDGTQVRTGMGTGGPTTVTLYGRIPPGQPASPGVYIARLAITVTW